MEKKQYKKRTAIREGNHSRIFAIKKHLTKDCVVCGRKIRVIVYGNKKYRGGHCFGKIRISSQKEWNRVLKLGTRKVKFGDTIAHVLKEDPKLSKYLECWECPKCYWK